MAVLNDKTKVSLGLAVIVIGGGAMWLTNLAAGQKSLADEFARMKEDVAQIRAEQKSDKVVQYQMATDIAVIKTLLESGKGK